MKWGRAQTSFSRRGLPGAADGADRRGPLTEPEPHDATAHRPVVLAYAPPEAEHAPTTEEHPAGLRIDMGPVPTAMFVGMILPVALFTAIFGGLFGWMLIEAGSLRAREIGYVVFLGAFGVFGGVILWQYTRHRGAARVIDVSDGVLRYQGPETGGEVRSLERSRIGGFKVRRDGPRPWLFRLDAVPPPTAFLSLQRSGQPVLLTMHTSGEELRRIAGRLTAALGLGPG
jgi:hypothetical protein